MTPKPQAKTIDEIDKMLMKYFNVKFDLVGGTSTKTSLTRKELALEIQALITEARIEELEKCLGFGEKYWAVNAHEHFNHRLTQLKKERANE